MYVDLLSNEIVSNPVKTHSRKHGVLKESTVNGINVIVPIM